MDKKAAEMGLWAMMGELFEGPGAWLAWLAMIFTVAFFGLAIWVLIQFLNAGEALEAVRWLAALMALVIAVGMLKLWFWLRMEMNRVIRTIGESRGSGRRGD